jgi:hypothetical protein
LLTGSTFAIAACSGGGSGLDDLYAKCAADSRIQISDEKAWDLYLSRVQEQYWANDIKAQYLRFRPVPGFSEDSPNHHRELHEMQVGVLYRNDLTFSLNGKTVAVVENYYLIQTKTPGPVSAECITNFPEFYGIENADEGDGYVN